MIVETKDFEYLLLLRSRPSEAEMIANAKVAPGGYAADVVSGIWRSIFVRSKDLKADYEGYFLPEYPKFSLYLDTHFELDEEVLRKCDRWYRSYTHVYRFKAGYGLLSGEDGKKRLAKLLGEGAR